MPFFFRVVSFTAEGRVHKVLHARLKSGFSISLCSRLFLGHRLQGLRSVVLLNSQIQEAASTAVMQVSECVSITLNHLSEPIHIISVYRPPRINKKDKCKQFFEEFKKLLDSLPQNSKVIFCGDLNINLLLQNNKDVITYENLLAEYGFTKCINKITRSEILADTLVESCLDHIYVRAPLAGINSAVIQHKISDHYLISVAVDWKQSQTVGIKSAGTPTHPSPEITASSAPSCA
ncbi:endonuclease-reverse transcriptase domain-containing protein [Phthorimaea operculella]|nr:endonuclease-reverse transcriptase domain-containing protein [Phthorimaea operculella]